jgi:hypothetical protein
MFKKTIVSLTAFAFLAGFTAINFAMAETDKGPPEMVLQATVDAAKKPKPATFPHKKHQDNKENKITCGDCHHTKGPDGKQVAYTDGMKIEKCETCHNKAAGLKKEIATFKDAAHTNCKGCHKEKKKGPTKKCVECHKGSTDKE